MGKIAAKSTALKRGYELDFFAWTEDQARVLRSGAYAELDAGNVAEEIESLGISDKRAIGSHLAVVLTHLLKWQYQPKERSSGWSGSIDEARDQIERVLDGSPSLKTYPEVVLRAEYARARRRAAKQTGLPIRLFPSECPFTLAEILMSDWYPESPIVGSPAIDRSREAGE